MFEFLKRQIFEHPVTTGAALLQIVGYFTPVPAAAIAIVGIVTSLLASDPKKNAPAAK